MLEKQGYFLSMGVDRAGLEFVDSGREAHESLQQDPRGTLCCALVSGSCDEVQAQRSEERGTWGKSASAFT